MVVERSPKLEKEVNAVRKTWDAHFMAIAQEVASMGTCARRQVGCVLVDERHVILATGMNGVPPKWEHCRDNPGHACPGAHSQSGTNLDACLATHAEINALLHCANVTRIQTVYCTTSPCISCIKALLSTYASRIVFLEAYPHAEAAELWTRYTLGVFGRGNSHVGEPRTWEKFDPVKGISEVIYLSVLK